MLGGLFGAPAGGVQQQQNAGSGPQDLPIHQRNYLASLQVRLQRVEQLLKDETPAALGFSYDVDSSSSSTNSSSSTGLTRAQQHNYQVEQEVQQLAAANPQQSQELLCRWQRAAQRNPDRQAGIVVPVVGLQGLASRISGASQRTDAIAQAAAATARDTEALTAKYNEMRSAVSLLRARELKGNDGSISSTDAKPCASLLLLLLRLKRLSHQLERIKKRHAILSHSLIRAIGLVEGLAVSRGVCEENPRCEAANEQLMMRVQAEFQWADWQQRIDVLRVWLATLQQQKSDTSSSSSSSSSSSGVEGPQPVVAPALLRLLTVQAETVEQLLQSLANTEAQVARLEASVQTARARSKGWEVAAAAVAEAPDTSTAPPPHKDSTAAAAAAAATFPALPAQVPLKVVGSRVALKVTVGGQDLLLALDSCKEGLRLFSKSMCSEQQKSSAARQPKQQAHDGRTDAAEHREEAAPSEQHKQQHQQQQRQRTCYDPDLSSSSMWCMNRRELCTAFSETSFTCRPSKQHDPKFAARYKQIVDGIVVSEIRLEGLDTVELLLPPTSASHSTNSQPPTSEEQPTTSLVLSNFPVKLVLERDTTFDAFGGLDGVWGIAGPDLCCREASLWNVILEPGVNAVGLDINLPPSALEAPADAGSFLHLSKDPNNIFGEMLWAERIQTGAAGIDALMHFSTYDWRLCGEQVGHRLSNSWEAIVDLSSECMVVPPPLWRSLRAWLPVNATHELCKDPDTDEEISQFSVSQPAVMKEETGEIVYRRTCPLLSSSSRRPLPAISFALSQSFSENPRIQLPLEQLVINEKGIGEVLCVVPQPFLSMGAEQWRQIRFGTRVLSALNVVMDRLSWRVGVQEKNSLPSSDASCPAKAVCMGDQLYVPYTNRCADPDCSMKILFELNNDTKVCELAWWVPGAVVTLVTALVSLELFVLHLRNTVVTEACSGGH
ncbi:hypothetical protein Esti_003985 [Eimeria stiedai]